MTSDNDLSGQQPGLTIVPGAQGDEQILSVHHRHSWALVTNDPDLQAAERTIGWDSERVRILGINRCTMCAGLHRGSVRECRTPNCRAHGICAGRASKPELIER